MLKELATVTARVRRGTKFSRMTRYRCADFLYLVVEENIFAEAEIPPGWGLLVCEAGRLRLARFAIDLETPVPQRLALGESIERTRTRAAAVLAGEIPEVRPAWFGRRRRGAEGEDFFGEIGWGE